MSSRAPWTSLQNKAPRNSLMVFQPCSLFSVVFPSPRGTHVLRGAARARPRGGAFQAQLVRRLPRAAPRKDPPRPASSGSRDAGAGAVAAETDAMKPRPAGFVDNKLKQRVIQVGLPVLRARRPRHLAGRLPRRTGLAARPRGALGRSTPPPAEPGLRSRRGAACLGPARVGGCSPGGLPGSGAPPRGSGKRAEPEPVWLSG